LEITLPDTPAGIRSTVFAALGCNTAWGIVDGVMYVLTSMFRRSRHVRLISTIKSAPDKSSAAYAIENELLDTVVGTLAPKEINRITKEIIKSTMGASPRDEGVTKDDVIGALLSFFIVFSSTFPVIVPFLFVSSLRTAVRLSNIVAIGLLFAVGYEWAGYTYRSRAKAGVGMVLIGIAIVATTVFLGG
jgi:VIT1/CCC1 family predicted Fe2+/Mn2+ transporter